MTLLQNVGLRRKCFSKKKKETVKLLQNIGLPKTCYRTSMNVFFKNESRTIVTEHRVGGDFTKQMMEAVNFLTEHRHRAAKEKIF